jgi:hypothetical protein
MAQVVSRRLFTAEAWVRFRVSPCGICDGQSGTGTGFSCEFFGFPLSISIHCDPIVIQYIIWRMNSRPANGRSSETRSQHIDVNNVGLDEQSLERVLQACEQL